MKTVLVVGQPEALADEVRNQLEPNIYRVLPHSEIAEAEPLLRQGFIDLCILDVESEKASPLPVIEQIHLFSPPCPIFVYAGDKRQDWEVEALLSGVVHILPKPFNGRVLLALMQRLWPVAVDLLARPASPGKNVESPAAVPGFSASSKHTLEVLRDFSSILCHSLCSEALLKQFLLQLREIIGINRAAVFLRPSPASLSLAAKGGGDQRMHAACAIGIAQSLLQHFDLSLKSGIGGQVCRRGHILRMQSEESRQDNEIRKEFELLGVEVAVPIWDRESLIGVAVFDGRLTGEPFSSEELSLIFLLLEQLGLALKNTWLHDQLCASHQIMMDILNQTGSGCLVVGRNLEILHANQAARNLFAQSKTRRAQRLEFTDLPPSVAGPAFDMLKNSQARPPFIYRPPMPEGHTYQVNLSLFHHKSGGLPNSVLVTIEDVTQQEKAKLFEVQSASHRLLKTMAAQLAHEIGNSLVPLSTHQQLLPSKMGDAEFSRSLEKVMADSVRRISRLSNQMLYLAMVECDRDEMVKARLFLEAAFAEAKDWFGGGDATLSIEEELPSVPLHVNRRALQYAFSEVLLNSLQANPENPRVQVRIRLENVLAGGLGLILEVSDTGAGFAEAAASHAFEPFYTTRSVGLGLGLTVAGKIIEAHQGKIEIASPDGGHHGIVRILLPFVRPVLSEKPASAHT